MGINAYGIHPYGYRPRTWVFKKAAREERGGRYFGIELEIDKGTDAELPNTLEQGSSDFYFTRDGSLDAPEGYSAELTTQPCSLRYHKEKFGWDAVLLALRNGGYKGHKTETYNKGEGTSGIHITTGRRLLDDDGWGKVALLIYRARSRVEQFSRRKSGRYRCYKTVTESAKQFPAAYLVNTSGHGDAINFKAQAVEFRVFRSTLNHATLLASIEFVHALIGWADTVTVGAAATLRADALWKTFTDFVLAQDEYDYLPKYLKHLGLTN